MAGSELGTDDVGADGALTRIEARLSRIEAMLGKLDGLAAQVPGLVAMAGDALDEQAGQDGRVDERVNALGALVERATRPETLQSLGTLIDLLDQAPGLVGMLGDVFDEASQHLEADGVDLHEATENGIALMRGLFHLLSYPETGTLIESGMLSRGALRGVNRVAASIAAVDEGPVEPLGPIGALRKLGDRDLQHALGFAVTVGKALGKDLQAPTTTDPTQRLTATTK